MTDHTKISPQPSIFARKGEAEPAPAVAYVSLREMQGKSDRRDDAPDRRAQWGERQGNGNSTDGRSPQRRVFTAGGTDHDGRRHYTPRSGLAMGQQYVPWAPPEETAEAPKKTARSRRGTPSVATLSALIHRHQDGGVKAAARAPAPAPRPIAATESPVTPTPEDHSATPRPPEERIAAAPTKIDMSYLSAAGAPGQRTTAAKSPAEPAAPAAPAAPQAKQPPEIRKRKVKRKKVTVRLEVEEYRQIKNLANKAGESYQSVMAAAITEYLNKID